MAVTYCRPAAASSETGVWTLNQSFGASFRLDTGLANDPAVLILLLAQMGGEHRSRFADRLEAL